MENDTQLDDISTGGLQSPHDYRDIPLAAIADAEPLPDSFFVEGAEDLPIWHQRKIGACVGHAAAKYVQLLNRKESNNIEKHSARYLYAIAKARDGYANEGTFPRLVADIIKKQGAALETTIPNDTTLEHEAYVYNRNEANIPPEANAEARTYRIGGYAFPNTQNIDELKRAIIKGHGAIILMRIGKEWYTDKDGKRSWEKKDIIPLRKPASVISGHEVYLYGYKQDGTRTRLYIINSWSEKWGDRGRAWFYHDDWKEYITEAITFLDIPNETLDTVHNLPSERDFRYHFSTDIEAGQRGEAVKALQTALMIDGTFDRDLYAELLKEGSLGYFKPNGTTQKALLDYQIKHKVASMSELLALQGRRAGAKTRQALNAQFGA